MVELNQPLARELSQNEPGRDRAPDLQFLLPDTLLLLPAFAGCADRVFANVPSTVIKEGAP